MAVAARETHTEAQVAAWRELAMRETRPETKDELARRAMGSEVQARPAKATRSLVQPVAAVREVGIRTCVDPPPGSCTF